MITDISLGFTAAGVVATWLSVWFGLRKSNHEQVRQFETKYVERYWKILDQLTLEALRATRKDPGLEVKVGRDDEKAIRSYILLCEDEMEQRAVGHITDTTYLEWRDGMLEQFENPMFKTIWREAKEELAFPYRHLGRLLEEDRTYDPLRSPKVKEITG